MMWIRLLEEAIAKSFHSPSSSLTDIRNTHLWPVNRGLKFHRALILYETPCFSKAFLLCEPLALSRLANFL